mmetsp:Transcript_2439/g.5261  ORF Transcript_2439/g.5261 Transcript_2439/m.5261 type:complete len:143 (-) Transcript_2439:192-620(-)
MFGIVSRRVASESTLFPSLALRSFHVAAVRPPILTPCLCLRNPHLQNSPTQTTVRNATKKAGGSSNNGRDSAGRRLGIKVWPGLMAKPGNIIVRQRGKKFLAGDNVGMGNDHTLYAKALGVVKMERSPKNRKRNIVHVVAEC